MQNITMEINLTLKGPLLTQSSNPGELGLDMVVARHSDKEKTPYLSGTLITGKLRQALEEIQDINKEQAGWFKPDLNNWLGQQSQNDSPKTKQLYLSDFDLTDGKLKQDVIRDRITINPETGAVKNQQIVMAENPFTSGENYTFTGKLHFFAPENKADNILRHIKTGFNWFTQLGSMKSVGFGQVTGIKFNEENFNTISDRSTIPSTTRSSIGLTIKPEYPFCIASKPMTSNNLFESDAIISGGAILGSIATTWNHLLGKQSGIINKDHDASRKALSENFSKLRITHAFPSKETNQRPIVAPLSLTKIGDDKLYDVALLSKPCLIEKGENYEPPDFALDWKDNEDTLKEYPWPFVRMKNWGWASLNSDLRVRTAIDREDYRSKKGELFAYEQIIPDNKSWYATLDLSRIDQDKRADVQEQLQSLLQYGIIGLSKTKTPVQIEFDTQNAIKPVFNSNTKSKPNKQWLITLQTDTLIGTPETLDETSGANELRKMYEHTWETELSNGKLKLIRYFARQKQSGGQYRKNVFQKQGEPYRPWLLTEAGSVFVLQATGDEQEAQTLIEKWLNQGLPLTTSQFDYYNISEVETEQWESCPFIPQNGYGEIAVNIDCSTETVELTDDSSNIIPIDRVED